MHPELAEHGVSLLWETHLPRGWVSTSAGPVSVLRRLRVLPGSRTRHPKACLFGVRTFLS